MKHTFLILLACVGLSLNAVSQKADPTTNILLKSYSAHSNDNRLSRSDDAEEKSPFLPMIIKINDVSAIDSLTQVGSIIWRQRNDLLLTSVPREMTDSVKKLSGISMIAASVPLASCMDVARPYCGVDLMQAGTGFDMPYDGSGVIAGFCDNGFDANHVAFKDRVKLFSFHDAHNGVGIALTNPQEIEAYGCDTKDTYHATHVANILAGGYKGNGYYGVATNADIAATTSPLDDVSILCGIEDIIDLAKSQGKRAVINLSLSSLNGPHDGTGLRNEYLSLCAKDAVICISAGNYGMKNISAHYLFTETGDTIRTSVNNSRTWNGFEVEGITEAWSIDDRPISMRIEVYDQQTKQIVHASPWIGGEGQESLLRINPESDPVWGEYFVGEILAEAELSPHNNRFCASVYYNTKTAVPEEGKEWSRYRISIAYSAYPGTEMQVFTDAYMSYLAQMSGQRCISPNSNLSLNDMCTTEGVIAVGACSTRAYVPNYAGDAWRYDFALDAPADFSSYGFGLPHICAPGNFVVSALSSHFLTEHPDTRICHKESVSGHDYAWTADCGTSMSAPYMAGAIALWLQANPSLTTAEIIDILQSTARTDVADPANPRWGAGCLDAAAGLRMALQLNGGIGDNLSAPSDFPIIKATAERIIDITLHGGKEPYAVCVYDATGALHNHKAPLAPGLYVVKVDNYPAQKIIVK